MTVTKTKTKKKKYKFRVLAGTHLEYDLNPEFDAETNPHVPKKLRRTYVKGDVVETDTDLAKKHNFPNSRKFAKVGEEEKIGSFSPIRKLKTMSRSELVAECESQNLEVLSGDTKPILLEKLVYQFIIDNGDEENEEDDKDLDIDDEDDEDLEDDDE